MEKTILTDVDGVLLDWTTAFEMWIENDKFPFDTFETSLHDYSTIEDWLGITIEETGELIREFGNTEYFKKLPAYDDAIDVVNKLKQEGYSFVAITACDDDVNSIKNRKENLNLYFPNVFDEIIHTGLRSLHGKRPHLEKWQNCFWVEDTYKHALVGQDVGHKVFLMSGNRNMNLDEIHDEITLVDTWYDIYKNITGMDF